LQLPAPTEVPLPLPVPVKLPSQLPVLTEAPSQVAAPAKASSHLLRPTKARPHPPVPAEAPSQLHAPADVHSRSQVPVRPRVSTSVGDAKLTAFEEQTSRAAVPAKPAPLAPRSLPARGAAAATHLRCERGEPGAIPGVCAGDISMGLWRDDFVGRRAELIEFGPNCVGRIYCGRCWDEFEMRANSGKLSVPHNVPEVLAAQTPPPRSGSSACQRLPPEACCGQPTDRLWVDEEGGGIFCEGCWEEFERLGLTVTDAPAGSDQKAPGATTSRAAANGVPSRVPAPAATRARQESPTSAARVGAGASVNGGRVVGAGAAALQGGAGVNGGRVAGAGAAALQGSAGMNGGRVASTGAAAPQGVAALVAGGSAAPAAKMAATRSRAASVASTTTAVAARNAAGNSASAVACGVPQAVSAPASRASTAPNGWTLHQSRSRPGVLFWYHAETGRSQYARPD